MNIRFVEYMNKGLVIVLVLMFTSTLGASMYFLYTMLSLNSLIQEGGDDVKAAFLLEDLMLNLRSAESGQRGYIITDNAGYLRPYNAALKKVPADLVAIKQQESFRDEQAKVEELEKLTNQKLAELKQALEARSKEGFDAAAALVNTNQGAMLTVKIQQSIQEIGRSAFSSIAPKQAASKSNLHRSLVIAVILDVFVLAFCAFILRYFHQTIAKERAIEGAKNEFLSLASHQLRTPATSVKQYLGMVQAGYFGKLTREQKEALSIAYQSNESEISIINSLLNVAKLNLQKITIIKKPVAVAPIVKQVVDEYALRVEAADQHLLFTNKLGKQKAALDATYFKTVVENLVDNASKYSPPGATITVRLARGRSKKLSPKRPRPVFRLSVSDTGVGIRKQDMGKLFKKFSRLSHTIEKSETVEGSGLGLYWVKQIVERHGGRVHVRSREGQGATFTVELPLVQDK